MKEKILCAFKLEHTFPALTSNFIASALDLPKWTAAWQIFSPAPSFYANLPAVISKTTEIKPVSETAV